MATSHKPIFVATHPRACSTAFERVFMTRQNTLDCVHEPFGDAFYFKKTETNKSLDGPERLSERYADDDAAREKSGFANTTYRDVIDQLEGRISNTKDNNKRVFIKDIIHYLFPPNGQPASIAPSLRTADAAKPGSGNAHVNGQGGGIGTPTTEPPNPTVIPTSLLRKFHFTFLIRHPRRAIPSYFRCTVPPLDKVTGFYHFLPSEAGYDELRRIFDFLRCEGIIGPRRAQEEEKARGPVNGHDDGAVSITVVDADDLLDKPAEVIETYCREVGIEYTPEMLRWDDEESRARAVGAFEKWNGFHDDAIGSTYLKPREHGVIVKSEEKEDAEWREKFGEEGQKVIRECVNANVDDYEYLKSFAIKGNEKG
ncbi:hypothetical protein B0T19DRAFT_483560 [Cercophora scortea]|uniref:P-loop containing nucleoside triphosphate hydrolase protein n=1 Tax=Cercophora scortea TaxID=314031 RepID=A0AAE0IZ01_9PEZI|nr:hypothetical protein B0T19DRAFT_483560 [Cercophora scortea]